MMLNKKHFTSTKNDCSKNPLSTNILTPKKRLRIFPLENHKHWKMYQNHSYHPSQALQRLVAHPPGAD